MTNTRSALTNYEHFVFHFRWLLLKSLMYTGERVVAEIDTLESVKLGSPTFPTSLVKIQGSQAGIPSILLGGQIRRMIGFCWLIHWIQPHRMSTSSSLDVPSIFENRLHRRGQEPSLSAETQAAQATWYKMNNFYFQIFYLCAFILKWKPHRHLTKMHSRNGSEYIAINNILITIYTRDKMTIKLRW